MEIIYILIGWLLGILSPGIIDSISSYYKKKSLKRVIINELQDLKKRLILIPLRVKARYGVVDKEFLIWLNSQLQEVKELYPDDDFKDLIEKLNVQDNDNLTKLVDLYNHKFKEDNPAFGFKKMTMSIIDSNLINIKLLDNNFLIKLLDIKFQINIFNEEIASVKEYLKMSFDGNITNTNYEIIRREIKNINLIIAEKAIYVVKNINLIINEKNVF